MIRRVGDGLEVIEGLMLMGDGLEVIEGLMLMG